MNDQVQESVNVEATETVTAQKRPGRPVDPNSGLARARALFASIPADGRTRKSVIAQFQSQLGLSKDTSAAYYSVINRKPKA